MKTKKLNQNLFNKMELNQADMKMVKGGEAETVFSGRGRSGDGGTVCEWCSAFDDGTVSYYYTYC
jgi:hypothetical protein